ncbi:MAG: sialate O-acetylesterase, partial [Lentisphaerota bacterium]
MNTLRELSHKNEKKAKMICSKLLRSCSLILFFTLVALPLQASVRLHSIFSDNMVLQRDARTAIFGFADDGISITVEIAGQTKETAAKNGKWKVFLDPVVAGGPHTLTVKHKGGTISMKNILFGDVWLASGQSNMQTAIMYYKDNWPEMFKDIPGNYSNDKIRFFRVDIGAADKAPDDVSRERRFSNGWRLCDPDSSLVTPATVYFFSKALQEKTGVPVGVFTSAVGGTSISSWIPLEVLKSREEFKKAYLDKYEKACGEFPAANEKYKAELAKWNAMKESGEKNLPRKPAEPFGPNSIGRPGGLYNYMISPISGFTIRGAIWYQGESDVDAPLVYRDLFPALIRHWRSALNQGDFPFYYVQLGTCERPSATAVPADPNWAYLRESQAMALSLPNTAMAVAIDTGIRDNVHSPFKQTIGQRLCAIALHNSYGQDNIPCEGPKFADMSIDGEKAVLSFNNTGGGLVAKGVAIDGIVLPEGVLRGFAVCGDERVFKWADAAINGDKVVFSCPDVKNIVAVRYAWANFPLCNLYNK